ncbi:hypothetical protein AAG570_005247 [Ranatra chinensis]|uniref:Cytochrome P450 n=1 Tax=Ranatra chinensis TaxID=642074 RepID=A0ABD0Y1G0_9HEMI
MVRSPRLLESILVKDFSHFHDHGFHFDADLDPLEAHLFNQEGVRWRALRNKLSPVFTTGRLRSMAPQMNRITDRLVDLLRTKSDSEVDVRNLVSRFAIDVIASCAFCLDSGALENPDCQFKRMADTIFRPRRYADSVKPLVRAFLPSVARLLGIRALPGDVVQFFTEVTTRAFQHRLKEGTVRNDFVDLLLELKIRGDAICEGTETEPQQKRLVFTDQLLAAQSFIFLGAGWETVSTAMALTLYFMGRHPEAQEEARRSVKKAKAAYGEIGFEAVKSMDYLDHCIAETMRLYPPAAALFRVCTRDYVLEDGRRIEKGTRIVVPVSGIQRDPQFWGPEADRYVPDRFRPAALKYQASYRKEDDAAGLYHREDMEDSEVYEEGEATKKEGITKMTYLPFGVGPRMCIGRFWLIPTKRFNA